MILVVFSQTVGGDIWKMITREFQSFTVLYTNHPILKCIKHADGTLPGTPQTENKKVLYQ